MLRLPLKVRLVSTAVAVAAVAVPSIAFSTPAPHHGHVGGPSSAVASHLTPRESRNAKAAVDLLNGAFVLNQPRLYAEKYLDANLIQHNPNFGNGREAFIAAAEQFAAPNVIRTYPRTVTQGDLVVVESLLKVGAEDRGTVIVDTFRFDAAGKIVEHWDAIQPVAATTANGNPQV